MGNIAVILAVAVNALLLLAVGLMFWRFRQIYAAFTAFITPVDDKTPSPLAMVGEAFSGMVGRAVVAQAKGFLMGLQSGSNRSERNAEADVIEAVAQDQAPGVGALLNSFPALKKSLRKNPGLMDVALQYLARKIGPGVTPFSGTGAPGNGGQPRFKL